MNVVTSKGIGVYAEDLPSRPEEGLAVDCEISSIECLYILMNSRIGLSNAVIINQW